MPLHGDERSVQLMKRHHHRLHIERTVKEVFIDSFQTTSGLMWAKIKVTQHTNDVLLARVIVLHAPIELS